MERLVTRHPQAVPSHVDPHIVGKWPATRDGRDGPPSVCRCREGGSHTAPVGQAWPTSRADSVTVAGFLLVPDDALPPSRSGGGGRAAFAGAALPRPAVVWSGGL